MNKQWCIVFSITSSPLILAFKWMYSSNTMAFPSSSYHCSNTFSCFKTSLFHFMQLKHILRCKALHQDLFWERDKRELGKGLLTLRLLWVDSMVLMLKWHEMKWMIVFSGKRKIPRLPPALPCVDKTVSSAVFAAKVRVLCLFFSDQIIS